MPPVVLVFSNIFEEKLTRPDEKPHNSDCIIPTSAATFSAILAAPFSPDESICCIPMASNSLHALPDDDKPVRAHCRLR